MAISHVLVLALMLLVLLPAIASVQAQPESPQKEAKSALQHLLNADADREETERKLHNAAHYTVGLFGALRAVLVGLGLIDQTNQLLVDTSPANVSHIVKVIVALKHAILDVVKIVYGFVQIILPFFARTWKLVNKNSKTRILSAVGAVSVGAFASVLVALRSSNMENSGSVNEAPHVE